MMSESQQIRHCCVIKVDHNVQVQECTHLYVFPWKWNAYRKQFFFNSHFQAQMSETLQFL